MHTLCSAATMAVITALAGACANEIAPSPIRRNPDDRNPNFTVAGTVTESGSGPPITMVSVEASGQRQTSTTKTDGSGQYVVSVMGYGYASLAFKKSGFEDAFRRPFVLGDERIDVRLQRAVVINAGERIEGTLYPDDPRYPLDFLGESVCEPCRLIRVNVESAGVLVLRLLVPESAGFGLTVITQSVFSFTTCCGSELSWEFAVPPGEVKLFVYPKASRLTHSQPFDLISELRRGKS